MGAQRGTLPEQKGRRGGGGRGDIGGDQVTYTADDGSRVLFTGTDDGEADNRVYRMRIEHAPGVDEWSVVSDGQSRMVFDGSGWLDLLVGASGELVQLSYSAWRLTSISDTVSRTLLLAYDEFCKLRSVTAPPLRMGTDDSIVVNRVFRFDLSGAGFLVKIWSPRRDEFGQLLFHVAIGVGPTGAMTSISDYEGNVSQIRYAPNGQVSRVTHPDVYDYVHDSMVQTSRQYSFPPPFGTTGAAMATDERGGVTRYSFDAQGRLTQVVDPLLRRVARLSWTGLNRLRTSTNVLGGVTTIAYDPQGDPTS